MVLSCLSGLNHNRYRQSKAQTSEENVVSDRLFIWQATIEGKRRTTRRIIKKIANDLTNGANQWYAFHPSQLVQDSTPNLLFSQCACFTDEEAEHN